MVYCRQDNTDENERKIEFILQRYSWQWDFANVGAFIIIAVILYKVYALNIQQQLNVINFTLSLNEQSKTPDIFQYYFTKTSFNRVITDVWSLKQITMFINELLSKSIVFFKLI
jgi:hypothetical protein